MVLLLPLAGSPAPEASGSGARNSPSAEGVLPARSYWFPGLEPHKMLRTFAAIARAPVAARHNCRTNGDDSRVNMFAMSRSSLDRRNFYANHLESGFKVCYDADTLAENSPSLYYPQA
ncbi:protein of unknown function [Candidatus Hydrogenisulfobacillus filiaventi]|uniref:Uncharacterized protein n=1 Tax=Candidatus Hydrogenisulfobacillus filiaventi TaxID=2707344 RepID=A0A6F8ZJ90_9FIRM|nr:protein of unknown function [Candidatus Hydrogenisulfobacillus filiaventi]